MAFIEWEDSLSVKVKEIDNQHIKLVDMINDLNDAMKNGKSKDVMGDILKGLVDYAATHFALEEKYFDQFQYAKAFEHKKLHKDFVGKISEFKTGFENGKLMLSMDIMSFLKDWLIKHIKGTDQQYSQCFNENGLS